MTLTNLNHAWSVIRKIAEAEGTTPAVIRQEMAAAIDAAWANPDPDAQAKQQQLFPAGKPSVEFFLLRISKEL